MVRIEGNTGTFLEIMISRNPLISDGRFCLYMKLREFLPDSLLKFCTSALSCAKLSLSACIYLNDDFLMALPSSLYVRQITLAFS